MSKFTRTTVLTAIAIILTLAAVAALFGFPAASWLAVGLTAAGLYGRKSSDIHITTKVDIPVSEYTVTKEYHRDNA